MFSDNQLTAPLPGLVGAGLRHLVGVFWLEDEIITLFTAPVIGPAAFVTTGPIWMSPVRHAAKAMDTKLTCQVFGYDLY